MSDANSSGAGSSAPRLRARTLEERILYSATPLMVEEAPAAPEGGEIDADAFTIEVADASTASADSHAAASTTSIDAAPTLCDASSDFNFGETLAAEFSPEMEELAPAELEPNQAEWIFTDAAESAETSIDTVSTLLSSYDAAYDEPIGDAEESSFTSSQDSDALEFDFAPPDDAASAEVAAAHIVLIDANLADRDQLVASITPDAVIITFDSTSESAEEVLARVASWAETSNTQISALSILSHGAEGGFQLGADFIDGESLPEMEHAWSQLAPYLTEDADLAIYGCNVAADLQGQDLLYRLAELTGADVAASDDLTGAAGLGGDWEFEFFTSPPSEFTTQTFVAPPVWNHTLATIVVTTTLDENNGDTSSIAALLNNSGGAGISLREAIIAANNTPGDDVIILAAGTYKLTITNPNGQEENGLTGDLDINSNITITGAGMGLTTIDGNSIDRVIDVNPGGRLTLNDLKITGGRISAGSTGSGILVEGATAYATLNRVDVNGNHAAGGFAGGGISNSGALTMTDSLVRNNSVTNADGGGILNTGAMTLTRVSIVNNTATNGAGISMSAGSATLTNVTVSGNTADYDGGGMRVTGGSANIYYSTFATNAAAGGNGGGLIRSGGTVNVQSSVFGDNTSMYGGRDLHGAITSLGYNVIENYNGITTHGTDSLGIDAKLGARTQDASSGQYYHALGAGSAALGKGGGTIPATDIRGVGRGGSADSGSYEANTAPVLSTSAAITLNAVSEDAPAPSGAVGTLISSLIDFAGGGGWDNVYDADGAGAIGIAITAADTTYGTWYFSTNGGATWQALGAVSEASARLLAANANTRLYFRPTTPDFHGNIAAAITFRAWDQSTGTNGGLANTSVNGGATAFSTNSETASISVVPVSDIVNDSAVTNENQPVLIDVLDNDNFENPGRFISAVNGQAIYVGGPGVAVTGGVVTLDASGKLLFTPNAEYSGAPSFTYTVSTFQAGSLDYQFYDGTPTGNTVNNIPYGGGVSGVASDFDVETLALALTDSDDAFAIRYTGSIYVASAGNYTFWTGSDDGSALWIDGVQVVSNDGEHAFVEVPGVIHLDAGYHTIEIRYFDNHGSQQLDVQYSGADTGGVKTNLLASANVGRLLSETATVNVTVNAVNDAPVLQLTNYSGNYIENGAPLFDPGATVFDIDSTNFDGGQLVYALTSGGGEGDLLSIRNQGTGAGQIGVSGNNITYGGVVIGTFTGEGDASTPLVVTFNANATAEAVQALARNITYSNTSDNPTASTRYFEITISDGDGGVSDPAHVEIHITPVNDAPVNTVPGAQIAYEDSPLLFSTGGGNAISITDVDANNSSLQVTLTASNGVLTLSGVSGLSFVTGDGTADAVMTFTGTLADINAALEGLTFIADPSYSGAASIEIATNDLGGGGAGGPLTDVDVIQIDVLSVNDAPEGADKALNITEDLPYALTVSDFGFADSLDSPSNNLLAVRITSLPTAGTLTLDGVAVTAGQFISAADIAAGKLIFTPDANAHGAAYSSFTFQVQDDGGTANGGVDLDQTPNTITFNVESVNDAPSGADKTINTAEDTPYSLSISDFGFTDSLDSPSNSLIAVRITSLPTAGTLTLDGAAVTAGQFISAADIAAGKLIFTPDANAHGAAYSSFTFQVQDDGGTANGGVDLDQSPNTITFNVESVNDAPSGADKTINTAEDTPYSLSISDFGFTDSLDSPSNSLIAVRITSLPTAGTLTLDGVAVTAGQLISAADIAAGKLLFTPDANAHGASYSSFTFQVQDDGGTANGGVDLDQSPNTITFNVESVNDAPTILHGAEFEFPATNEDTPSAPVAVSMILSGVAWSDVDAGALQGLAITGASGNGQWQYSTDGVNWTDFGSPTPTNALLLDGDAFIRYLPDGENTETAQLQFVAWDQTSGSPSADGAPSYANATTGGGDSAFSAEIAAASLFVADLNDAPTMDPAPTFSLAPTTEDEISLSAAVSDILAQSGWADPDAGAVAGIAITGLSGSGTWQYSLDGSNWTDIGAVSDSAALLLDANAQIRYVPDGENGETATFTYRAWDQTAGSVSADGAPSYGDATATGGVTAFSSEEGLASIDVAPINDAPIATIPDPQTTPTDIPLTFSIANGNAIQITDVDAGGGVIELQLTATDGVLTLSNTSGLTIISGADGSAQMTIRGTVADLNAALNGLTYTPDPGFGGAASIFVVVDDLGNQGAGGPLTDSHTIDLKVGTPGIIVTPLDGATTTEAGGAARFSFQLATRPTDDVTITFTTTDPTEGVVSTSSITFTAADWNIAQIVTISGVNDFVDDGDQSYWFIAGPATSNDVDYAGVDPADFQLTNLDDDVAGITVTPLVGSVTEAGGQATFTIVLTSQPTDDVTIQLLSSDDSEAFLSVTSITFTAQDWNIAQSVTVTGLQDYINDGDTPFTILILPASSADSNYNGLDPADINAINWQTANQAPVNHLPTGVSVAEDESVTLSGSQKISISDVDAGSNELQVTLHSEQGHLTLSQTSGLTFLAGDGVDDSYMQFRGSADAINAALDGLTFLAAPDFNGLAHITISTDDLGNSGHGGALTDTDILTIVVTPVNDRPFGNADFFTASNTQTLVLSAADLLANDGDIDSANLSIVLLSQPATGQVIQTASGDLLYIPNLTNRSTITFQYAVSDGEALSDPVTVTIEPVVVAPIPQAPVSLQTSETAESRDSSSQREAHVISGEEISAVAARKTASADSLLAAEFDPPSFSTQIEEMDESDNDSDTGVWIEESRDANSSAFSIFAGSLENRPAWRPIAISQHLRAPEPIHLASMDAILERMRSEMESQNTPSQYFVSVVSVGTATAAAGYVFWALRGLQASAMLLSATPTWASFDLLPILASGLGKKVDKEDDESLGQIAGDLTNRYEVNACTA